MRCQDPVVTTCLRSQWGLGAGQSPGRIKTGVDLGVHPQAFGINSLPTSSPYGELVLHGVLLGAVSLFSIGAAAESNHRLKAVVGGLNAFAWLKNQDQPKLDAEKNAIQERLKAVGVFRDTRVKWSGSLRTIAASMPESTIITSLSGDAEIDAGSKSGPSRGKKKLIVSFETPLAGNGSLPQEIDGFLAALRADATLKRHFPLVEVSGFRSMPVRAGGRASTSYSVVCLPLAEKGKK